MFSFHKPRVYRSAEGCCICRAKSSSSRFTDSRKYQEDSVKCFNLKYPRYGEICNACVLLVKRFKRLPAGSQRHWGHVVDARAGPGTKAITKIKRSKDETSSHNNSTPSSQVLVQSGKSIISERFSKIFKKVKNKKHKLNSADDRNVVKVVVIKSPNKLHNNKMTLLKRPNSIESDNENSHESSPGPTSPQNVSSLYISKNNCKPSFIPFCGTNVCTIKRKNLKKCSGSKRRKKQTPQKNRISRDTNVKFFDEEEWTKRTTCCGVFYECPTMPGATIIDLDELKFCQQHRAYEKHNEAIAIAEKPATEMNQNSIKATIPAMVKLSLPKTVSSANINPSAVLKKHHLFYKRQSESFPYGDIVSTTTETTTNSKTESKSSQLMNDKLANSSTTIDIIQTEAMGTSKVQVTVSGSSLSNLPRQNNDIHLSTIFSPLDNAAPSTDASNSMGMKTSSFLRRIKSDAGKIVKHSIEKINSAVRLKAQDLNELKHIVKTVDKNYITSKSACGAVVAYPATTTLAAPELSPTSTSSAKFSDNSSDSGFDENMQDRKSVSPLQQENDVKRPPVQTLILSSGVRVHGQQQNLVYAGNEAAAKIIQNRIQQQNVTTSSNNAILQQNKLLNVQPLTMDPSTSLKLVQTKSNSSNIVSIGPYNISGGGVKMRPLLNSNTIQHENGITTIVPASSLDATKQAEAILKASGPNIVTITPATSNQIRLTSKSMNMNYQFCENNESNAKVLMKSNQSQLNLNNTSLNQKFILLKTNAPNANFGHNYNCNNNNHSNSDIK